MVQLIVSAVGPDRPGIVGEVTAHIHQAGGNILDSRMVNLRGQFALMILLECSEDKASSLAEQLPAVGKKMELKLAVTPQQQPGGAREVDGLRYRLKTYSVDQPAIVARLTG